MSFCHLQRRHTLTGAVCERTIKPLWFARLSGMVRSTQSHPVRSVPPVLSIEQSSSAMAPKKRKEPCPAPAKKARTDSVAIPATAAATAPAKPDEKQEEAPAASTARIKAKWTKQEPSAPVLTEAERTGVAKFVAHLCTLGNWSEADPDTREIYSDLFGELGLVKGAAQECGVSVTDRDKYVIHYSDDSDSDSDGDGDGDD